MPNDSKKILSTADTVLIKSLSDAQGWWACSACGAHFPVSIPPLADNGVTQCSSCANVKILSATISAHYKCLTKAITLMRDLKYVTSQCTLDCGYGVQFGINTSDLLLAVSAFLDKTSLLLMHWEKDSPHV